MHPLVSTAEITGVIIAGGKATRMGGMDKGLVPLAGKPMIRYVIDALRPQVAELLINTNRDLDAYRSFGFPVVSDHIPGYLGPVAGITTALEASTRDLVLTAPCDAPLLPPDLATRLHEQMLESGAAICVPHDGTRLQPLFGLYHRSLAADMRRFLHHGDRKLLLWLELQAFATADFSDRPEGFNNINAPEDLTKIEQER